MAENTNISKKNIERSKIASAKIDNKELRKRAFALNIAANTTAEFLTSAGLETDTKLSLFRIPSFAKSLELADIYVKGIRLDVRITFDGKTFTVPKIQEKYSAKPYAYIVVQLSKDLTRALILGFVSPSDLQEVQSNSEYLFYSTSVLKPIQELRIFLSSIQIKQQIFSSLEHDKIKELCASFLDDEISDSERVYFIKHVIACPVCRETLCDINDFDAIVSQVKNYHELLNDSTLSVLSGNKKEVNQAALAGLAVVENAEEILEEEEKTLENNDITLLDETAPAESLDEISIEEETLIEEKLPEQEVLEDDEPFLQIENDETEQAEETSKIAEEAEEVIAEKEPCEQTSLESQTSDAAKTSIENELPPILPMGVPAPDEELPSLDFDGEQTLEQITDETSIEETISEPLDDIADLEPVEADPEALDILSDLEALSEENIEKLDELQDEKPIEKPVEELFEEPVEGSVEEEIKEIGDEPANASLEQLSEETSEKQEDESEDILQETDEAGLELSDLETLDEIQPEDDLTEFAPAENIDTIDEIAEEVIEEIEPIEEVEALEEVSALEEVNAIELKELEDLQEIEELNDLEGLENLEQADEISLIEEEPLETLSQDIVNAEQQQDTPMLEPVEKEPFSLTLEGEEEILEPAHEEPLEDMTDIPDEPIEQAQPQEPVELVYDDEIEEQDAPQPVSSAANEPEQELDEDIQGLLDDDLLALLSDGVDLEQEQPSSQQEQQQDYVKEFAQEQQIEHNEIQDEIQEDSIEDIIEDIIELDDEPVSQDFQEPYPQEGIQEEYHNETIHPQFSSQPEEQRYQEDDSIESLYGETNVPQNQGEDPAQFELAQEPVSEKTVNATKKIVIGLAVLLILAGGSAASWFFNHAKTAQNNTDLDAANQDNEFFNLQNKGSNPEEQTPAISQDINKSMTNSFSDKPAALTITKLSWQVSEKLAQEASVKEYLQTAGKNIQMNLQNDLANSADINFNNSIKVSFEIAPDNTMKGMQVLESSGSDQIDDIVLRSIKNTLKYVSVPKLKDFKSDYFLTLIINF